MMRARLFAIIAGLALGTIGARGANPPGALDQPPSNVLPGAVEMTPQAGPQQRAVEQPLEPTGNPLWGVPLSTLTATRERPLFTPSRRAPAPAVAGPVVAAPPAPPPQPPAEPERPQLVLVGAIASGSEGIAVFLDQATNNIVRLRTGQDHSGWVLRSVKGREATLQKDQRTTTLTLPVPGEAPAFAAPPGMPGVPGRPRGQPNDEPL
jgi:general secretion pathway protein N